MGVSVPGGRSRDISPNLVPFVDLMTTLLAFLLTTAVWIVPAVLHTEHPSAGGELARPVDHGPLVVHVARDAVNVVRSPAPATQLLRTGAQHDWDALGALLDADRDEHPGDSAAVLVTDDGVPYGAMIAALDRLDARGYAPTLGGRRSDDVSRP